MDDLYEKYDRLQRDLNENHRHHPYLSDINAWERRSMQRIQAIAEDARQILRRQTESSEYQVRELFPGVMAEIQVHENAKDFDEIHLKRWTQQLLELRQLLDKPSNLSLVEEPSSATSIGLIRLQASTESHQERFVAMFGPCRLTEGNLVATHTNYRAGLSQITGAKLYASGQHSIRFLIEAKGSKNLFLGVHSSSKNLSSSTFDQSVHGWWNLDYPIVNGESHGGQNNEIFQAGDEITLIVDCDQHEIQLKHHRTKRLVQIPIQARLCPLPWKILVRLINSYDCLRIL